VSKPDVLCFGEALWDITPDGRLPGGAPMNVALRLAEFGVGATLLSRVGDDVLGHELIGYLSDQGLDTARIQVDGQQPTGRVNVDTSNPQAVRYDIVAPAAWDYIDAGAYLGAAGERADAVVFGSLAARHEQSRDSLLAILDRAMLRIFDVNLRPPFDEREIVEALLQHADWVKLNESELDLIAGWLGVDGSDKGLAALAKHYRLDTVCVTLGDDGAILLHQGRLLRQPAFRVEVVDSIGCGDAFLGSWLAQMLAGRDAADALRRACAVGSIVASRAGASARITESMIRELLDRS